MNRPSSQLQWPFHRTLALAIACLPGVVTAHGSMEEPLSRIYACYKENPENPHSAACMAAAAYSKPALYDWMSVRIGDVNGNHQARIPDGRLCSAGDATFAALDAARDDWPATLIAPDVNGRLPLRFHATAPHATAYIQVYVTGPGYDPNMPLTWSDLAPFCEHNASQIRVEGPHYVLDCPFPAGISGRHLLYTIWQRSDSPEAFYACSDVIIGDAVSNSGEPGGPVFFDLGPLTAETDLEPGSTLTFRLFAADGADLEQHMIEVDAATAGRETWPAALAAAVNAASSHIVVGQLANGAVQPVTGATANRVFTTEDAAYHFLVDVALPIPEPSPDPNPGPDAPPTWNNSTAYPGGAIVRYQGVDYKAKWWTRGDVPGDSAPWQRITPSDGAIEWATGAVYLAGDQVSYQGNRYEARWWTQGNTPGTHEVWRLIP